MNILKELPIEVKNRITSKAYKAWGESKQNKKAFVEMYEKLSSEAYFQRERDKAALAEYTEAADVRYNAIMRENERLLTKIQNLQAPCKK